MTVLTVMNIEQRSTGAELNLSLTIKTFRLIHNLGSGHTRAVTCTPTSIGIGSNP